MPRKGAIDLDKHSCVEAFGSAGTRLAPNSNCVVVDQNYDLPPSRFSAGGRFRRECFHEFRGLRAVVLEQRSRPGHLTHHPEPNDIPAARPLIVQLCIDKRLHSTRPGKFDYSRHRRSDVLSARGWRYKSTGHVRGRTGTTPKTGNSEQGRKAPHSAATARAASAASISAALASTSLTTCSIMSASLTWWSVTPDR